MYFCILPKRLTSRRDKGEDREGAVNEHIFKHPSIEKIISQQNTREQSTGMFFGFIV